MSEGSATTVSEAAGSNPGSLAAQIKEKRQELSQARHLDLEIPGYNGLLVARYVPVDWDEMKKIAEKVERSKNPRKELLAHADTLIIACDEIFARQDGELVPLHKAFGLPDAEPVGYDDRLAGCLDIADATTARQVLLRTFENDLAVTAQHNVVAEWMQESRQEDDEDFLGESQSTRR